MLELSNLSVNYGLHRVLDDAGGMFLKHHLQWCLSEGARVTAVPIVDFLGTFVPANVDLRGVDHDDKVARKHVSGVLGLMLAHQQQCHLR